MKKIITISFTFYLLLSTYYCYAQQVKEKAMAAYFKAKDYGSRTQWEEGILELQKAIKIEPNYTAAKELLGEFFYALKMYDDAIFSLENCADAKDFSTRYLYLLSELYLKISDGDKAKYYAEKYLERKDKAPKASEKATQTILNANFAIEAKKNPVAFNPKNVGSAVNTTHSEYFPYLIPDGKILTFTRMDAYQEDLFYALRMDSLFSNAKSFGNTINSRENEGASAMDAQGNFLFVTACNRMDGYGSCDIYYSTQQNNQWLPLQGIGKPVNTGAWDAQPSFAADGSALYFVSNRPGGYGGRDIWVSYLDENMKLSTPENLGPNINTKYDDQCPFIHADQQTLYFTSNGWPGMGNSDIFISRKIDSGWTKAENIGYPINTENDENGLTVSYDGKTAFLASNREGGFGGLDIYSFELPENRKPQQITYLKAIIKNAKTKQLIQANYSVVDLDTKNEIKQGHSNQSMVFIALDLNKNNALQIQKEGYLFYSQNIHFKEYTTSSKPFELDVFLEPIATNSTLVLNNVFYDFDKSNLKTESFIELDKLVDLLYKNPSLKIEIGGYTDDKGDEKYNQILSQKRAETVLDYLVQKGIDKMRLNAKGYGESKPIAPNDTEENKAKNRRTEVKVL